MIEKYLKNFVLLHESHYTNTNITNIITKIWKAFEKKDRNLPTTTTDNITQKYLRASQKSCELHKQGELFLILFFASSSFFLYPSQSQVQGCRSAETISHFLSLIALPLDWI